MHIEGKAGQIVLEGSLAIHAQSLTLDGAYLADEVSEKLSLERNTHGALVDHRLGDVRITIERADLNVAG